MKAVHPLLLDSPAGKFTVPPQQRWEAALKSRELGPFLTDLAAMDGVVISARNVKVTINTQVQFCFWELAYPGGRPQFGNDPNGDRQTPFPLKPVLGKWVYVVRMTDGAFLAEIFYDLSHRAYFREHLDIAAQDEQPDTILNMVPAPPASLFGGNIGVPLNIAAGDLQHLGCLLSPVRLTKEAMNLVKSTRKTMEEALVRPVYISAQGGLMLGATAMPDPFQWTEEAHDWYFTPLLEEWIDYISVKERQKQLFIASAMESWIKSNVPKVKDRLRDGEPDRWLFDYRLNESNRRFPAEFAQAYLMQCMEMTDHKVVERACTNRRENAFAQSVQHFAVVVENLQATEPGRHYAFHLLKDEQRTPSLVMTGKAADLLSFKMGASTWKAALSTYKELYAFHTLATVGKPISAQMPGILEAFQKYQVNAAAVKWSEVKGVQRAKALQRYDRIQVKNFKEVTVADSPSAGVKVPPVRENWKTKALSSGAEGVSLLIDVVNLVNAIVQYRETVPKDSVENFVSYVSLSADMASIISKTVEYHGAEEFAWVGETSLFKLAGLIGSICGVYQNAGATVDNWNRRNYLSAVGTGLSTATGAVLAVASGLAFVGGQAMKVPGWVGAVGAVVTLAGAGISIYFSWNEYEQFAGRCFLGKKAGAGPDFLPWMLKPVPTSDIHDEALTLDNLLANFKVTSTRARPGNVDENGASLAFITIEPGIMRYDGEFVIEIVQVYGLEAREKFSATFRFKTMEDAVVLVGGSLKPVMDGLKVTRSKGSDREITGIVIPLRPLSVLRHGQSIAFEKYRYHQEFVESKVRIRLTGESVRIPALAGKELVMNTVDAEVTSLDDTKWE